MLKKPDWQVLEEIDQAGTISHHTYLEKYHKKLQRYPLDLGGAFEEEIREASPKALIQISELSGDMLLFLPRWDYEGCIVNDNKSRFHGFGRRKADYLYT